MTGRNPYRILGVRRDATADELRRAFRKAVLKYHPDVYDGDPREGATLLNEAREAYESVVQPAPVAREATKEYNPPPWKDYATPSRSRETDGRNPYDRLPLDPSIEAKLTLIVLSVALAALVAAISMVLLLASAS